MMDHARSAMADTDRTRIARTPTAIPSCLGSPGGLLEVGAGRADVKQAWRQRSCHAVPFAVPKGFWMGKKDTNLAPPEEPLQAVSIQNEGLRWMHSRNQSFAGMFLTHEAAISWGYSLHSWKPKHCFRGSCLK